MRNKCRLLIVADDPFARSGLGQAAAKLPGCIVEGQCAVEDLLDEELDVLSEMMPDVIVWDFGWKSDPIKLDLDELNTPIVALVNDTAQSAEAWQLGARALLRRDGPTEQLETAVKAAAQGLYLIDPRLSVTIASFPKYLGKSSNNDLTPREQEVLNLIAQGLTNRAIAQQLEISPHTAKYHVNAIMSKLNAQNRTEAVVQATRLGYLSL